MSIKVLTIINPTSGKGNIANYANEIKHNLEKQDMEVNMQLTKEGYNAKKIILDNIEGQDLILICGVCGLCRVIQPVRLRAEELFLPAQKELPFRRFLP